MLTWTSVMVLEATAPIDLQRKLLLQNRRVRAELERMFLDEKVGPAKVWI